MNRKRFIAAIIITAILIILVKLNGSIVKDTAPVEEQVKEPINTVQATTTTSTTTTTITTQKTTKKTTKKITTTKKATQKKTTLNANGNKQAMMNYAHDLVISYGWTEKDYEAVVQIVNHESSWNANSVNKSSGACGLFQALPCNKTIKNGYKDYKTNWKTQIRWGLDYIKYRYKTPSKAWAFWQKHHWY